jgi:hypothetical protein
MKKAVFRRLCNSLKWFLFFGPFWPSGRRMVAMEKSFMVDRSTCSQLTTNGFVSMTFSKLHTVSRKGEVKEKKAIIKRKK